MKRKKRTRTQLIEEARRNELLLRATVTGLPIAVFALDPKGRFVLSEGKGLEILDIFPEKVLGRSAYRIFYKTPRILKEIRKAISGKYTKSTIEIDNFTIQIRCAPVMYKRRKVKWVIGVVVDITERKKIEKRLKTAYSELKKTQEQLIQAEKMRAVVRIASGVVHEVKNPLGTIIQGVDYLEENLTSRQKDIVRIIQLLKDNAKRADDILRSLLDFSRPERLKKRRLNINSVLESSLGLIADRIRRAKVEVIKKLNKDLPKILVDKGRMEQVFINILLNALQAMPRGGKLYIKTYAKDRAVVIEIQDTGVGISKEDLKGIFEPFFTTRKSRGGTGLGLSIIKKIIEMHKGSLDIKSKKGRGTKVIINLNA